MMLSRTGRDATPLPVAAKPMRAGGHHRDVPRMHPIRRPHLLPPLLEGPATGSAVGWDMTGTVLALSETDIEKLLFYLSCFSSAGGIVLCYVRGFLVCLACVDLPACWVIVY